MCSFFEFLTESGFLGFGRLQVRLQPARLHRRDVQQPAADAGHARPHAAAAELVGVWEQPASHFPKTQ